MSERVLPAARAAVKAAKQAVARDQAPAGAVAEAKRKRLAVRQRHLEALAAYHLASVGVEQLIARSLRNLTSHEDGAQSTGNRQSKEAGRAQP